MTTTDDRLAKLESWLTDPGDWIGVFECEAMDSQFLGERIAIPYTGESYDLAEVGKMSAPDSVTFKYGYGAGWKFILKGKHHTAGLALEALTSEERL